MSLCESDIPTEAATFCGEGWNMAQEQHFGDLPNEAVLARFEVTSDETTSSRPLTYLW